jgi:hypothetical protein
MKLFLAIALLSSLALCEGEIQLNIASKQEMMQSIEAVMQEEGLMKCVINRDLARRPDSKCLIMFKVSKHLQAVVSILSSVVVDVVFKKQACNVIEEILNEENCREVIRLDIRKRFHLEFHSKEEEIFIQKIVTRFVEYLVVVKRQREQHLSVDVDQKLHLEKPQTEEEPLFNNKIVPRPCPEDTEEYRPEARPSEEDEEEERPLPPAFLNRLNVPQTQNNNEEDAIEELPDESIRRRPSKFESDGNYDNAIYAKRPAVKSIPTGQKVEQRPNGETVQSIPINNIPPEMAQKLMNIIAASNNKDSEKDIGAQPQDSNNESEENEEVPPKKYIVLRQPKTLQKTWDQNGERVPPLSQQTNVADHGDQLIQL